MAIDPAYRTAAEEAWRALNDSPMQRRLREEAPCWVGVVYWNPQQDSAENIRYELTRMRECGYTFVRFHATDPIERDDGTWDFSYLDLRVDIAHEVGLQVYPHMGLNKPSRLAMAAEGLSAEEVKRLGLIDERARRAVRARIEPIVNHLKDHPAITAWPLHGEPPATSIPLTDDLDRERFAAWLREHYDSPAAVHAAWLIYPDVRRDLVNEQDKEILAIADWEDAVRIAGKVVPGDNANSIAITGMNRHELFGARRDLVRFRADTTLANARILTDIIHELDPDRPVLFGNHQLFYSNGQLAWDQFGVARTADGHFSSIHLSWHFESARGEVARPHYMQSRLTADAFKGGHTNAYETTSGPVQYSGGYGNHMDAGMMRLFMFDYLAAGNEGIAFWDWIPRPGGIEAGEYGMISLSGRLTEWAEEGGRITRAMERYRHEIWAADDEAELAILRSWDTETVMCCEPRRFDCADGPSPFSRGPAQQHLRALIGAGRTAIDAQVAFVYVTETELREGIAGVYPAIYLPHVRCCSEELLEVLLDYVEHGGHLIGDVQLGFEDSWGKLRRHGPDSSLDRIFGGWIDNIHDARTRPQLVDGVPVAGFYGDLVATRATTLRRFADGRPAALRARTGAGTATLLAFDPAREAWQPGNHGMQRLLAEAYRAGRPARWSSDLPMTYRRSTPTADHWFVINDGEARSGMLQVFDRNYKRVIDVMTDAELPCVNGIPLAVEAHSGLWLRTVKDGMGGGKGIGE